MVQHEPGAGKRLDGWKSIAGYFNRDRTTAMRWARDRGMPVHRMPGGKQGSVFAFEQDLAAWALNQGDLTQEAGETAAAAPPELPDPVPVVSSPARRVWLPLAIGGVVLLGVGNWAWQGRETPAPVMPPSTTPSPRALEVPRDPAVARDFVAARDAWARRTPADLERAITLYAGVLRRDPGFAPAHAGVAEAWLILREYGRADEATAYRNARRHVAIALKIDPQLPAAHRAMGFIDYWWDSKSASATEHFRHALALDDRDPQTHFWFANMLADIGDDATAQAEYDKARLLDPGSRVIAVEQACSHWQAGRDAMALEQLTALARTAPGDATIQNCLAWAYISQGDIVRFAEALRRRAEARGEPRLLRLAARMDEAVRRDPATAVEVLIGEGRREIAAGERQLRETPAFYASAMGDRPALIQLMTEASDLGEHWPSVPVTRRIAARWPGDRGVQRLLARLVAPRR